MVSQSRLSRNSWHVSTDRQGKSGLGLAAQREAVMSYLDGGRWALVDEFTEVESGKRNDRPELVKAITACKKQKAKLVIAKLDRLSRNLAFIATLMDSGVEFVAVDNPHANKLTVHILAAVAQPSQQVNAPLHRSSNSVCSKPDTGQMTKVRPADVAGRLMEQFSIAVLGTRIQGHSQAECLLTSSPFRPLE
jgi:hypothetical protein